MVLLWKKWVYCFAEHFENKLTALRQTQSKIQHFPKAIKREDRLIVPTSMVSADTTDSITFYEPRVIVKYKKDKHDRKGRSKSQSVRKCCKSKRSRSTVRRQSPAKRKMRRSQTLKKCEHMISRKNLQRFRF